MRRRAYAEEYLNDAAENQEKLFDFAAQNHPDMETEAFNRWGTC